MFAIITVALISGAIADRLKFGAWLVFAGLWATFVYFPVAHWVFAFDGVTGEHGGWIANKLKAIDFAGGTAVHINAGAAGLVLALVLGKRNGLADDADAAAQPAVRDARRRPAVVRLVRLQRRFGARRQRHRRRDVHDHHRSRPATAMLGWLLTERIRDGHATSLGAASGIVAGLVAITPSCSLGQRRSARWSSASSRGVLCALAVGLKFKFGFDDSLDVVGVHLVGGLDRHPADRLLVAAPGGARPRVNGSVLRRRVRSAVAPGSRCRSRFWPTRRSLPLSWP